MEITFVIDEAILNVLVWFFKFVIFPTLIVVLVVLLIIVIGGFIMMIAENVEEQKKGQK